MSRCGRWPVIVVALVLVLAGGLPGGWAQTAGEAEEGLGNESPDALLESIGERMGGEESDAPPPAANGSSGALPSFGGILARLTIALGVTLAVLYGALLALKRFLGRRASGSQGVPSPVRVLSRSYLSAKSCVYLVEIGGRILVVGENPGGLTLLTTLSGREALGDSLPEAPPDAGQPSSRTLSSTVTGFISQLGQMHRRQSDRALSEQLRQGARSVEAMSRRVGRMEESAESAPEKGR